MGFVFTPATSTVMSIVQIGGFYTDTSIRGVYYQQQGEKMITAIGKVGQEFVKKLYTAKKFAGKKTDQAVTFLGNRKKPGMAKAVAIAGKRTNEGIKFADKTIRKYPKTASAVGGAIAFDIFDDA